jgi:hypothetical protein
MLLDRDFGELLCIQPSGVVSARLTAERRTLYAALATELEGDAHHLEDRHRALDERIEAIAARMRDAAARLRGAPLRPPTPGRGFTLEELRDAVQQSIRTHGAQ